MLDFIEEYIGFEDDIEPTDYIDLIRERASYKETSSETKGTVYVPGWYNDIGDNSDKTYRCTFDAKKFILSYDLDNEFEDFYKSLEQIAEFSGKLTANAEHNKEILNSQKLFDIWNAYIRDFDTTPCDEERNDEIVEKIECFEIVKNLGKNLSDGKKISDDDMAFLTKYHSVRPTSEDWQFHNNYVEGLKQQCVKRVGASVCHYQLVIRAKRVYGLMMIQAPNIIIRNEGRVLAMAFLMHKLGISITVTDNTLRRRQELISKYEFLEDDDKLDRMFARRNSNATKSMLPLLVYFILRDYSDCRYHLKQQEILVLLENLYGVSVERKALGRTIHGLVNLSINIYTDKLSGTWLEQDKMQYDQYTI